MTDRDNLLREFAQLTTPETPAAPTFHASGNATQLNITGNGNSVALGANAGRGAADRVALWLTRFLACTLSPTFVLLSLAALHAWLVGDSLTTWAADWRWNLAGPIAGGLVCGWIAVFVWSGVHQLRSS